MINPKREHFTLLSASLVSGGGVSMKHKLEVPGNGETDYINGNEDITIEPSEDFSKHFNVLKATVARVYKYDIHRVIIMSKEFQATKEQGVIAEKAYQEILSSINIKGIRLTNWNTEDNKQVVILAEFTDDYKHVLPLNTKEIHLTMTTVGTEAEVQEACENIANEAYKYRYEGKRKNPTIFNKKTPNYDVKTIPINQKKGDKKIATASN